MKNLLKNTFLGLSVLFIGTFITSCDKDGDGDSDLLTPCYECSLNNQSDILCKDNYQEFVQKWNLPNVGSFEQMIENINNAVGGSCKLKL